MEHQNTNQNVKNIVYVVVELGALLIEKQIFGTTIDLMSGVL